MVHDAVQPWWWMFLAICDYTVAVWYVLEMARFPICVALQHACMKTEQMRYHITWYQVWEKCSRYTSQLSGKYWWAFVWLLYLIVLCLHTHVSIETSIYQLTECVYLSVCYSSRCTLVIKIESHQNHKSVTWWSITLSRKWHVEFWRPGQEKPVKKY